MDECQNVLDLEEFDLVDDATYNMGQSESKKSGGKRSSVETKGTAMSFGFKRKHNSANNKKHAAAASAAAAAAAGKREQEKEKAEKNAKYHSATVISNPGIENGDNLLFDDDNGNTGGSMESLHEKDSLNGRTTPRLAPSRKETAGLASRSNRFGFRQSNVIRPASTGLTPKITDCDNVANNNFNNATDKRRSRSASGVGMRSLTPVAVAASGGHQPSRFGRQESPMQVVDQRPIKINATSQALGVGPQHSNKQAHGGSASCTSSSTSSSTGLHRTNANIVRPTPQPAAPVQSTQSASVSKYTLQSSSLPRPQVPVPISLTSRYVMDTKGAKQAMNATRKGFFGPRDVSTDSGFSSHDSGRSYATGNNAFDYRQNRQRPRNLQVVMSGRHTFAVRDLMEDSLSDDSVAPLALPRLPNDAATQLPAPLSGLVHTPISTMTSFENDMTQSFTASEEEEKAFKDKTATEKIRQAESSVCSKTSSPGSSRTSWCNAGESMAYKDYSSVSVSSDDSKEHRFNDRDGEFESTTAAAAVTMGAGQIQDEHECFLLNEQSSLISPVELVDGKANDELSSSSSSSIMVKADGNILLQIEDSKFAEMAAAVSDILLDDETSPTDSLVSSCTDPDDMLFKRSTKKKRADRAVAAPEPEPNLDDISPELDLTSPLTPGTPTHASNSLSLSETGRDFLIDDEIADQPELVFDSNSELQNSSVAAQQLNNNTNNNNNNSSTDTATLIDSLSVPKHTVSVSPKFLRARHAKLLAPLSNASSLDHLRPRHNLLSKAESLDTLSPCESIASDDMMLDFECNSSNDSIDFRAQRSTMKTKENGSALNSIDDIQLWSELEAQGENLVREWTSLLRVNNKPASKESITSQLPARATRLLSRSRVAQGQCASNAGSDSPRSVDSMSRRTPTSAKKSPLFARPIGLHSPTSGDAALMDKNWRNSMIQDVLYFKKQLFRLRGLLQEDEEALMRTDTLNPFEISNGKFFGTCDDHLTSGNEQRRTTPPPLLQDERSEAYSSSNISSGGVAAGVPSLAVDDSKQELADVRRQVVYLQGQIDDRDRTIRIQRGMIAQLEADKEKNDSSSGTSSICQVDVVNTATQTERLRPVSMGQESMARSEQIKAVNRHTSSPFKTLPQRKSTSAYGKNGPVTTTHTSASASVSVSASASASIISTSMSGLSTINGSKSLNALNQCAVPAKKSVRTTQIIGGIHHRQPPPPPTAVRHSSTKLSNTVVNGATNRLRSPTRSTKVQSLSLAKSLAHPLNGGGSTKYILETATTMLAAVNGVNKFSSPSKDSSRCSSLQSSTSSLSENSPPPESRPLSLPTSNANRVKSHLTARDHTATTIRKTSVEIVLTNNEHTKRATAAAAAAAHKHNGHDLKLTASALSLTRPRATVN